MNSTIVHNLLIRVKIGEFYGAMNVTQERNISHCRKYLCSQGSGCIGEDSAVVVAGLLLFFSDKYLRIVKSLVEPSGVGEIQMATAPHHPTLI